MTVDTLLARGLGNTLYNFDHHNTAIFHYTIILLAVFKEDPRSEVAAKAALDFCRSAFKSLKEGVQTLDAETFKTKQSSLDVFINSLRELNAELAKNIEEALQEQEPMTSTPPKAKPASSSTKSGCFVATACYGDCDHPVVMELRQFRDDCLEASTAGQKFVRWYYIWSPAVASIVAKSRILKSLARVLIVIPALAVARIINENAQKD